MTRIRRVSDLIGSRSTPTCTQRSVRRRQAADVGPSLSARLLRLGAVLVVGSLALGIWNMRVGAVTVEGMCLVPRERAAELASPLVGARWVTAPTSTVERELSEMNWVECVRVQRRRPGRVSISVREHQPLFRCEEEPGTVITCCGTKVAGPPGLDIDRLPFLQGDPGEGDSLAQVLACLQSSRWPFRRALSGVRLNGDHGIEFVLEDGTEVWLGQEGVADRLAWLVADPDVWRTASVSHIDLRYDRQVVMASNQASLHGSER